MIVNLRTKYNCSYQKLVELVNKSETLTFITKPLVVFKPSSGAFPKKWVDGKYETEMLIFGKISFGKHIINIENIKNTEEEFILRDNGYGDKIKKWDHWIIIKNGDGICEYTDRIDILAGWKTVFIYFFAVIFFSHRQLRWKKLLKTK